MDAIALPSFEERYAAVKGVRLRYYVGGSQGEPLLLVHGLGGAASNWVELAPRLAERHRVIIPELPGHGGSSPLPAAPNLDVYAARAGLVAERERLFPAAVVGHSLGGLVALRLALLRPTDVTAVILAAAAGISSATRRAEKAIELTSLVRPGRLVAPYRAIVARHRSLRFLTLWWGVADTASLSSRAVAGFLAGPALHTDTVSAGRAMVLDDVRADLHLVRTPCLILWGARDRQTPIADAFDYARRLRAPLHVIPDCGHLLIGERPDACADAIETFLRSHGRK